MEKNKNIFWFVNNSEYHHREMGLRSTFRVLGIYNFVLPTSILTFEEIFIQIRSCMHIPKLQQHVIFPLQFHFLPLPQSIKLH